MGTTKKLSGKTMGYVILIGLVIVSWVIFKILTPHNFGSFSNMLNYAIVGCVLATKFNLGYFGLIVGGILTGTIVGLLNGIFYVKLRIPSMIVTTGLALIYESLANYMAGGVEQTLKSIRTYALGYYPCIGSMRCCLHILKLH